MISSKQEYLDILRACLENYERVEDILLEYEQHLTDLIAEISSLGISEAEAMEQVIARIGKPKDMAALFSEERTITASRTKWIFFFGNFIFFAAGLILTVFYHSIPSPTVKQLWFFLTSIPFLIIFLYLFYWLILRFEVGKEFGLGGKKLFKRTFYIALMPNLFLMMMVVLRIIPPAVFAPLLTNEFTDVCIVFTILFYPVSILGFRYGTTKSI
ncbi:HAAS signaling domain-containing protein [Niallia sp. BSM11]|uniref:HAAS signaling domain-containing protein n=1 Tax=Niallia sp. BSM11 TaxID=3391576 RepID=UPI0039852F2E